MPERPKAILCPFCGHTQLGTVGICEACGGHLDAHSIRSTLKHMGPWFIRDRLAPFRPGCSYRMLVELIRRGKVGANSIIRGPTSKQLWTLARRVPGVAHLVGFCDQCGTGVKPNAEKCELCGAKFYQLVAPPAEKTSDDAVVDHQEQADTGATEQATDAMQQMIEGPAPPREQDLGAERKTSDEPQFLPVDEAAHPDGHRDSTVGPSLESASAETAAFEPVSSDASAADTGGDEASIAALVRASDELRARRAAHRLPAPRKTVQTIHVLTIVGQVAIAAIVIVMLVTERINATGRYGIFALFTGGLIAGVLKHREGRAWGSLLALCCAAVIAVNAVVHMRAAWPEPTQVAQRIIGNEMAYAAVATEMLGRYLAEAYPDSKVMIVLPFSHQVEARRREAMLSGLERGLGDRVEVVARIEPQRPDELRNLKAEDLDDDDLENLPPQSRWFNWRAFVEMVGQHRNDCDLIVSLVNLPPNIENSPWWRDPSRPKIALAEAYGYRNAQLVRDGGVVAGVTLRRDPDYDGMAPPQALDEAFAKRYELLTPQRR